jgi:hypothetical protein
MNKEENAKKILISGLWIQIQPLSFNMLTWLKYKGITKCINV